MFPSKGMAGLVSLQMTLPPTWKPDQTEGFRKYHNNSCYLCDSEHRQLLLRWNSKVTFM